jgi:hypothetical protein
MPTGFLDVFDWIINANSLISMPAIKYAVLCNSKANDSFILRYDVTNLYAV